MIVVDGNAQPLRVACDFCRSEHNYRGGPTQMASKTPGPQTQIKTPGPQTQIKTPGPQMTQMTQMTQMEGLRHEPHSTSTAGIPRVPQGAPEKNQMENADLERLIRKIIREETGLTPVTPAEKWRGGELVLKPGKPGVQEKSWPIDSFFHKVVMLRNRLRTLEQQVNASDLPDDQKLKIQGYITGCYGSLTSFNVLFADEDDRFVGASQE